jgi:hypothetical protein
MEEMLFLVAKLAPHRFAAQSLHDSIFVEASSLPDLKRNIINAVDAQFDGSNLPAIRYKYCYVRTFSLIVSVVALVAWECEIGVVLLHLFARQKLHPIGHAALLLLTVLLTVFAWYHRDELRALPASYARLPLSRFQIFIVSTFIMMLCLILSGIMMLLVGN